LSLNWQEREANRFAAELLMPEPTVRALHDYYCERFGRSARFLEGHLAADLLVSRQAVQYRLADLGLGDSLED
jgi:Zn-dependent peptidase ImmA (M78 family)